MSNLNQTEEQDTKRVSLTWPVDLWEQVSIETKKRQSSLQDICTEAVCKFLKIPQPKSKAAA